MAYTRVASLAQIAPGTMIPVDLAGQKLLVANVGGTLHAAGRKCPHLGFNLCKGKLDGNGVVCPLHKAKFDLTTGAVERDPKLLFITMTAKSGLTLYPVKVEGDAVLVDAG